MQNAEPEKEEKFSSNIKRKDEDADELSGGSYDSEHEIEVPVQPQQQPMVKATVKQQT